MFKTRTLAATAIASGKVRCNDTVVKASKQVAVGEVYELKNEAGIKLIEVVALVEQRKAFSEAVNYYNDLTPVEIQQPKQSSAFVEYTGKRQSKQGRPTKRDRRSLDRLL